MTIAAILGSIASIAAIVGAIKYWSQLIVWLFKKSDDQKNQDIDSSVSQEEDSVNKGGRPKWD